MQSNGIKTNDKGGPYL